jgi:ABC-type glycerol-3-phosphate transport system substrate-binding protein
MAKKSLTRRDFIKVAGATLGTSVLAACAPQVVTQVVTSVVEQTKVVTEKQTQIVNQVITATPVPTAIPEPAVLDIWWNTNLPDLTLEWKADPNNDEFKKEWFWGGLGRLKYLPFMTKHPGVKLNITSHSWDTDLRQNQLLALASGIVPDTTYGEAYVLEFVGLGVYADLDPAAAALFAPGPLTGATKGGKFYGFPKSTGCDVVFVNLDKAAAAKLDTTSCPKPGTSFWPGTPLFRRSTTAPNGATHPGLTTARAPAKLMASPCASCTGLTRTTARWPTPI